MARHQDGPLFHRDRWGSGALDDRPEFDKMMRAAAEHLQGRRISLWNT